MTATPSVLPLWHGPAPSGISTIDAEECKDGLIFRTFQPRLTILHPAAASPARRALIICPGGGYNVLEHRKEGLAIAEAVIALGLTACVLTYRLRDWSLPDTSFQQRALSDAQRAIRLVRALAPDWGIDPRQIGIGGFSAGAHLSAGATTRWDDGTPDHADPLERQSCRPDFGLLVYGSFTGLVPVPRTPPCFLVHAADDAMVPVAQSLGWFTSLQAQQALAALHVYSQGGHGFALGVPGTPAASWLALFSSWLEALPHE